MEDTWCCCFAQVLTSHTALVQGSVGCIDAGVCMSAGEVEVACAPCALAQTQALLHGTMHVTNFRAAFVPEVLVLC